MECVTLLSLACFGWRLVSSRLVTDTGVVWVRQAFAAFYAWQIGTGACFFTVTGVYVFIRMCLSGFLLFHNAVIMLPTYVLRLSVHHSSCAHTTRSCHQYRGQTQPCPVPSHTMRCVVMRLYGF